MRIGVAGWFGSDNLGDELLLHSLLTGVRTAAPGCDVVVVSPVPERVTALHDVPAVAMPVLRRRGAAGRQAAVRGALAGCDVLLLGPGTVFQERSPTLRWPGTLPMFARITATARAAGVPVAVAGAGVREGGTPAGRALLRGIGAACVAVGVRDRRSAAPFGPRAEVIGDLAYALPLAAPGADARPAGGRRFAVSARPLPSAVQGPLVAALTHTVDAFTAAGWSGAFLPMAYGREASGEDDTELRGALPGLAASVPSPLQAAGPLAGTLDRWLARLAAFDLVVGVRLHAVLLAVALGVPSVAIAYERKVRDAFTDLGLSRFVVGTDVDGPALSATAAAAADAPEVFAAAARRVAERGALGRAFLRRVVAG